MYCTRDQVFWEHEIDRAYIAFMVDHNGFLHKDVGTQGCNRNGRNRSGYDGLGPAAYDGNNDVPLHYAENGLLHKISWQQESMHGAATYSDSRRLRGDQFTQRRAMTGADLVQTYDFHNTPLLFQGSKGPPPVPSLPGQ